MNHQRRGSVYLAVIATVSAVTVLSLTGVALRKSFNERARTGIDSKEAHRLARSAAELAIHLSQAEASSFAEQAQASGTIFENLKFDGGSITATATDAESGGRPSSATERYLVETAGEHGVARSRLSFELKTQEPELTQLVRDLGAIAYWPLDEATGTSVATDVIGSFNGTYVDSSRSGVDTHAHGNAAPQNDWITHRTDVPHNDAFLTKKGSLAFWARWDSFPLPGLQMAAISKETLNHRDSAFFYVSLRSGGDLEVTLNDEDDNGGTLTAPAAVTAGTWHHIVIEWGGQLCVFVDGALAVKDNGITVGLDEESGAKKMMANTGPWMFGARNQTVVLQTPAYPTFGSVARVALFDKTLSPTEVADLYAASSLPGPLELEQGSFVRVVD